jgi:hypothetical protein
MANPEFITYTLPSGATIEVENIPERRRGPGEVSKKRKGESLPFDRVIAPIGEVAQLLFEKLRSAVTAPDKVVVELGASLKGGASVVLVSGESQASIKVILTWDNKKAE